MHANGPCTDIERFAGTVRPQWYRRNIEPTCNLWGQRPVGVGTAGNYFKVQSIEPTSLNRGVSASSPSIIRAVYGRLLLAFRTIHRDTKMLLGRGIKR